MTITIKEVIEEKQSNCLCVIDHCGNNFEALVNGSKIELGKQIGTELVVEISFDSIIRAKEISNYSDTQSLLVQEHLNVLVVGKVHSVIQDEDVMYDIYLQNGPEFLTVIGAEWPLTPIVGAGVEFVVSEICFYPTNT